MRADENELPFDPNEYRLETDNLETRPLATEEKAVLTKLKASENLDDDCDWEFDPDNPRDPELDLKIPTGIRILRKRIVGEKLKIKITKKAYLMLGYLFDRPGKIMILLHYIGNTFEKLGAGQWLVDSDLVLEELFSAGIFTDESLSELWDQQKLDNPTGWSDNKVDFFPDAWRKN